MAEKERRLLLRGIGPQGETCALSSLSSGEKPGIIQYPNENYVIPVYPANFLSNPDYDLLSEGIRRHRSVSGRMKEIQKYLEQLPSNTSKVVFIALIASQNSEGLLVPNLFRIKGVTIKSSGLEEKTNG
ncbi:MAG: hypothetical protein KKB21_01440 [Nanoarchaeota archaeon]|nr:hypothetical protein [Nanoarchaeota archaeon]MBU4086219.1 hypothetical protein [Nanoarchaeota archaeon]